ncbi:hypothetical protein ACWEFL_03115 [Streptomyces sp. NPDC004838]
MPEAKTDPAQTRPQAQGSSTTPDAGSAGKHRGLAASDDTASEPHGKHRKPTAA